MEYYKGAPRESVNKTRKICTRCNKSKHIEHFSKDRQRSDGRYSWCKKCKFEHNQITRERRITKQVEWNKNNRAKWRAAYKVRRANRTTLINKLKSVPCADCGYLYHPFCMDFDHRPGTIKCRDVSQMVAISHILEEVKKCDVVCANCHRLRTFNRINNIRKKQRGNR